MTVCIKWVYVYNGNGVCVKGGIYVYKLNIYVYKGGGVCIQRGVYMCIKEI